MVSRKGLGCGRPNVAASPEVSAGSWSGEDSSIAPARGDMVTLKLQGVADGPRARSAAGAGAARSAAARARTGPALREEGATMGDWITGTSEAGYDSYCVIAN